jgi:putative oxidoreductase
VAGSLSVALGIWPDVGALMIGAFVIPAALYFHRFWEIDDPIQKQFQQQLFYRNLIILGASLVMFGAFVELGSDLPFTITGLLFEF